MSIKTELEKAIEQRTCENAKNRLGVTQIKIKAAGRRGFPDRMFLIPGGRPLFIEFKRPGGKLGPMQVHTIKQLKELGYHVEVHDDSDRALQAIGEAVETAQIPERGA